MAIQPGFAELVQYKILVKTGDKLMAGTDANVFIGLFGSRGTTGRIPLPRQNNSFERDSHDEFTVTSFNVGRVNSIEIGHDNHGLMAGWFLDSVIVHQVVAAVDEKTVKPGSTTYRFEYHDWIATDEGDHSLVKTLKVVSTEVNPA